MIGSLIRIHRSARTPTAGLFCLLIAMLHLFAASTVLGQTPPVVTDVSEPQAASTPPNILLILCDDLGWADVSFNGRREWSTPHIDSIARDGCRLDRFYSGSVVCAPSRAVLLTGRYTIHNGVTTNSDDLPSQEQTIPEALKAAGYATALVGKWHQGNPPDGSQNRTHPLDQGFDEFAGYIDAVAAWEHFPKTWYFGRESRSVTGYSATLVADHGLDFVRRNQSKPFFLLASFIEPHLRIEAPDEDVAPFLGKLPERNPKEPNAARYAAMVTRLDREIGRLLGGLDELGIADNTLVIFTSDHGATFESGNVAASVDLDSNKPFRGGKRSLYEGGIRVPAAVRWTGRIPAGSVSTTPGHFIDLLPTLCHAANVPVQQQSNVDGISLLDHWTKQQPLAERTLFWEWRTEGYNQLAAMRNDWKLMLPNAERQSNGARSAAASRPLTASRAELYNVVQDPAERRNQIAVERSQAQRLHEQLSKWLQPVETTGPG